MTPEEMIEKVRNRFPHVEVLDEVEDQKQYVKARCTECDRRCEFEVSMYLLLRRKAVTPCECRKQNEKKHIDRLAEAHPNVEYLGGFEEVKARTARYRCRECGHEWIDIPDRAENRRHSCPNYKNVPHEDDGNKGFWLYDEAPNLLETYKKPSFCMPKEKRDEMMNKLEEQHPELVFLSELKTTTFPILVECKECHTKFFELPLDLMHRKSNCRFCGDKPMTYDEFIERLAKERPNAECLSTEEEFNADRKHLLFRCRECGHEFEKPNYMMFQDTYDCPKCAFIKPYRDKFYAFMDINYSDFERISDYEKVNSPILYKCPEGHIVKHTPQDWRSIRPENACLECAGKIGFDTDKLKKIVTESNPNLEVVSEFTGWEDYVTLHCKRCGGYFEQRAISIRVANANNAHGLTCRHCERWGTWNHEDFVAAVAETSPDIEVVGRYTKNNKKILCRCKRCHHYIMIRPDQLHLGVDACLHCKGTGHSSRSKLYLLYFLQDVLGIENVISTDKETIGKELDIYVPFSKLAIEWNGWFWHHDKEANDFDKYERCRKKGIKLLSIYDGMSCDKWLASNPDAKFPPDAVFYEEDLFWGDQSHEKLRRICKNIYKEIMGEELADDYDWDEIEAQFERYSGSEPYLEDFEAAGVAPPYKVNLRNE